MLGLSFRWRIVVAIAVLSGTLFLWWKCSLSPLQRYYFWPYLNCALQGNDPALYSEIQWLYKTAPRRKQELTTDRDVVAFAAEPGKSLPMKLSATARQKGWKALVRADEEWVEIRILEPFLRQDFYEGQSLWRMLVQPVLWSAAILLSLMLTEEVLRIWRKMRHSKQYWRRWKDPQPALIPRFVRAMERIRLYMLRLVRHLMRTRNQKSALNPSASTAVPVRTGVSLPGVPEGSRKAVWSPPDQDRLL
jgi:hypothetical protein